jgi:glycosyltransferase involved in cell wall biosynthesis
MKIALVTEGTYPVHPGGVSQWCHQLIRGLPEFTFDVVSLSGSGRERLTYALPRNVRSLHRLGLWGDTPWSRWLSRSAAQRFAAAYEQLLESILSDDPFAPARFETALHKLYELGTERRLLPALRSQMPVDVFLDVWARRRDTVAGGKDVADPTLADALAITDLIEHYLRPLQLQPLDVDVVHATANGPSALIGLLSKWERRVALLVSEHGVYLRERILATRDGGAAPAVRVCLTRFFFRLTELGYRNADAVLPVSDFNGRWARRHGAASTAVRIVHNGVDPIAFPLLTDEPETPTLVFVGRIDPLKDLETLIRAFAIVRDRVPDARLRLFGPVPSGNEEYAASCEQLVANLELGSAVTFEGPVDPAGKAFAAGHLVVLSSISEGLPLIVIEAAMSGRATVATDVGGMAEAVGNGGVLVPARDPSAFADACTRLLEDSDLRRELAATGRQRALDHFALDRFLADFRKLYRSEWPSSVIPAPRSPVTDLPSPSVVGAP